MSNRATSFLLPFLTLGTFALLPFLPAGADEMNMVKLHVDRFTVVGLEARTSNAQEAAGNGPIGQLWGKLQSEQFVSHIPNRVDSRVVAVYSNYEGDKDAPYTYLLGAKVSSAKEIPPGMAAMSIQPGTYAMFTAEGDPPPQMVLSLWKRIWSLEKPDQLHRAYKTDYEVHYTTAGDSSAKAHVDIYIGVRDSQGH